jgi:predicted nucleic acid-binding protein
MRVLLDTSAYSAFKRGNAAVVALLRQAELIVFNAIVLGELLSGFGGGRRETQNRKELAEFLRSTRVQVVPIAEETAERFVLIHRDLYAKGTPIPTHDMWIAATALEYGLRILTTDAHFSKIAMVLTEYVDVSSRDARGAGEVG